ncbi:hypothetical protein EVAR_73837_1 [Eumeta japonica]|uniref:CUB domain-containing protein n=1 Tax=Eumeta variegata TaxID=151549 RepID=A0A4C1TE15_EUMVA|nr:hypothetical protein EVAR_73837_1 [Eumeta japonica]
MQTLIIDSSNSEKSKATGDIYSFTVSGDVEGADNTVLGTALGAVNDGGCTTDFVVIANPIVSSTGVGVGTDRFCGIGFVTVQTSETVRFVRCNGCQRRRNSDQPAGRRQQGLQPYVHTDRLLTLTAYQAA